LPNNDLIDHNDPNGSSDNSDPAKKRNSATANNDGKQSSAQPFFD